MNEAAPFTVRHRGATDREAPTNIGQLRKSTRPLGLIHALINACALQDANSSDDDVPELEEWALANIDEPCHHILHHWRIIELSPLGVCYWPIQGPRYRIFAGTIDRTTCASATAKIVMFDPVKFVGKTAAGRVFGLGPDYGFDSELTAWYPRQYRLVCASPKDVTAEILRGSLRNRGALCWFQS